jgi:hypothetical protein
MIFCYQVVVLGVLYGVPAYLGACLVRRLLLGPRP